VKLFKTLDWGFVSQCSSTKCNINDLNSLFVDANDKTRQGFGEM
jgi:hypothetical protein